MLKILVLEDDELFAGTLKDFLEEEEFNVTVVHTGEDAEDKAYEENFDLFILDINLPGISGFDVTKTIRENKKEKPILFLTSARDKETLLKSFEIGGDEFLTKPVDFDELLVRIHALLRRSKKSGKLKLFDGFTFDMTQSTLYKDEKIVEIGNKSATLLRLFLENSDKVVTKNMIEEELYSGQEYSEGSVRVYVTGINNAFGKKVITNVRGVGYKFEK
ncbi:MAG: response regulator transcription factor [Campylobacterales bacterium]|nr:response regulator transcription factor [Campylobacterales bacterium]